MLYIRTEEDENVEDLRRKIGSKLKIFTLLPCVFNNNNINGTTCPLHQECLPSITTQTQKINK